ncbi:MAG TPA: PAS domain S-box protein [Clostridiales bacterium]|nr:PAS domain S-box protein [Clostridiales bacterium]HQP69857.1 PAS domain S-box protein [Clostridiales bacterium]
MNWSGTSSFIISIALVSIILNVIFVLKFRLFNRLSYDRDEKNKILVESEKKYKTLVESLIEGIGIVDGNECFTFANKAGCEIFGCCESGLVGKNLKEFTSPNQFDYVLNKTMIRKSGTTDIYELDIVGCDKIKRTILVKSSPIIDEDGNYKGAFGLFTDITEHKKNEEKRDMIIRELETKITGSENLANGILPVCASCHKIRDKENKWHEIVDYFAVRTKMKFSHSICPECKKELYR